MAMSVRRASERAPDSVTLMSSLPKKLPKRPPLQERSREDRRRQPLIIVSEMKGKERTIHFQASKGDRQGKRDRSGCSIDGHIIQAKRNEDER
jgi:hypothetical protein